MKKQKVFKKKLFSLFIIFEILIFSGTPIYSIQAADDEEETETVNIAGGISDPIGDAIRTALEDMLDINIKQSLEPLTEQLNLMDGKVKKPEININFEGTIRAGENLTATAAVDGISNHENAYFTWYIIPEGADPSDPAVINEGKLRAIKENIKANSNFNPLVHDQIFNGGNGNGILDPFEIPEKTFEVADAFFGGDNNRDVKNALLYMHGGAGKFYQLGEADEISYEECYDEPSDGGRCPGPEDGRNYGSDTGFHHYNPDGSDENVPYSVLILCPASPNIVSCDSGFSYRGMETDNRIMFQRGLGKTGSFTVNCETAAGNSYSYSIDDASSYENGSCEASDLANDCNAGIPGESNCEVSADSEEDFEPYDSDEMHLFPRLDGKILGLGNTLDSITKISLGMDPTSIATTSLGIPDIDLIRGKGVSELTFKYSPGDRIGVIVEGLSTTPTPHYDEDSTDDGGGFMPIFSFMAGGCDLEEMGGYMTDVKGKQLLVPTAAMTNKKINKCLADNLVEPGSSEYDALNLSLTSNWGDLVATSGVGSTIEFNVGIKSDSGKNLNPTQLHYQWNIKCGDNENTVCEEGDDVTQEMREAGNIFNKTKGNNINSFNMEADFPDSCFDSGGRGYACTTLQANTNFKGNTSSYGMNSIIIPIQKSGGRLKAYSTTSDGQTVSSKEEICGDGIDEALCRVVRGEIIGIEMFIPEDGTEDLISWTVNGQDYSCNSSVSSECIDETNTNKIFFPVVGDVGDYVEVIAVYNDPSENTHGYQVVPRKFRIVEPKIIAKPIKNADYKFSGNYVDVQGNKFPDKSDRIIEIIEEGNSVDFKVVTTPSFIDSNLVTEWEFNGDKSYEKTLQIVPESSTNLSLKAVYRPDKKEALANIFGINQYDISDFYMSTSVRLVAGNNDEAVSKNKAIGFFATTASNTPAYFFFLLKMVLMVSVMLFVSHLALSFTSYNNR
ncbi:MAG: hypothetical protein KAT32_00260 [Candidatus Moranbacteria bacterium]|nr:hypothetical protein [Candidatus Moranbacteria bacterium]